MPVHQDSPHIDYADTGNPTVMVVGASGFAGALMAQLLHLHPGFELGPITARAEAGKSLHDLYPQYRVPRILETLQLEHHASQIDAAVVAYPHGASAPVVAELLQHDIRVIDLSADFRFADLATYQTWYGEHPHPKLLDQAVYGLPELNRSLLPLARLVAGPGCFPTGALLGLQPLARAGLIGDLVIDAKMGISGAGRKLSPGNSFVAAHDTVSAYRRVTHRHRPEIETQLRLLGAELPITFMPHLVPVDQGEYLTCYVTPSLPVTQADVDALYKQYYEHEPFVELATTPPTSKGVRNTNYCSLHPRVDDHTGRIMVFVTLDNLWKGTASQALQSLNCMYGYVEATGLLRY
jgi:N-acetyl-gamma-glutamyl-phosphate reductase